MSEHENNVILILSADTSDAERQMRLDRVFALLTSPLGSNERPSISAEARGSDRETSSLARNPLSDVVLSGGDQLAVCDGEVPATMPERAMAGAFDGVVHLDNNDESAKCQDGIYASETSLHERRLSAASRSGRSCTESDQGHHQLQAYESRESGESTWEEDESHNSGQGESTVCNEEGIIQKKRVIHKK